MKFSIRDLLALVFLLALAMLAWRTLEEARRAKGRFAQLEAEIKTLQVQVRLDQPALHQAILRTREEFEPLRAMRERSLAHYDVLRQKYSALQPRATGVLSVRGVPALQTDTGPAPVIFRLRIPKERPAWLKFGVHMAQSMSSAVPDKHELLTDAPFVISGPFQRRLSPGDQTLKIASGPAQGGSLPLVVSLEDKILLRSSFVLAEIAGTSSSHVSALSQLDRGPGQELPWLLTANLNLREPTPRPTYAYSFWLSDRASDFKDFPDE